MLPLEYLILEVTRACNHACVHCYNYWTHDFPDETDGQRLSRKEIRCYISSICQETKIGNIGISGGEPMLRKDISGIVNDMTDLGLNVVVISNGSLVSDSRIKDFPAETTFELTLFSSEEKIHDHVAQHIGAFRNVIKAAVAVRKQNCGLAIACVLNKYNLDGLSRTIELALALGTDGIIINRVNLTGRTYPIARDLVTSADELKHALEVANKAAVKYGMPIAISVPVPPCVVDTTPYKSLQFGWCPRGGSKGYYTIGFNGLVRPCNHSSVILGDIRKQTFKYIVSSAKTKAFWSIIPPECITCKHPLRDSCRGGCPAASYECYENQRQRDPFIEFAGSSW